MYINGHSHAKHFCALKGIGDHTGPTGSMAWNSILKPRLQLQVPNQMEVKPLKTSPVRQHGSSSRNTGAFRDGYSEIPERSRKRATETPSRTEELF
ncbi:hypothetical protein DNTS_027874 [Danionella cerebrum]|uniref:Uncharacterized protein n=1 Tax=Danionella cerebrum TaxID=2873325 RepID=A0A553MQN0_9TELE|nr:hypothetical protein DNTS_027874 [Danionella translucida]